MVWIYANEEVTPSRSATAVEHAFSKSDPSKNVKLIFLDRACQM